MSGWTTFVSELRGDGRGRILFAVAFGWFFSVGVRLVFPALLPQIRTQFGLGLTAASLLISILYFVYALGQFPGGVIGDHFGERAVLLGSTTLALAAVSIAALSPTVGVFAVGLVLFGFGTALYAPSRFTLLSAIYPDRDGTAIGVTLAAGNAGNAFLPATAGLVAAYAGWRLGVGFAAPFLLLAVVFLYVFLPQRIAERETADGELSVEFLRELRSGLGRRPVLLVTAVLLAMNVVWQAFTGLYPTYLVVEKGFSETVAALVYGSYFAAGMLIQPLSGAIGDRFGHRAVLVVLFGFAAVALAALPFVASLPSVVVVTLLMSGLLGSSSVTFPYLIGALPERIQTSGLGFIRSGYMIVASGAPLAVGALGDVGYFREGFLLLAVCTLFALILSLQFPKLSG